MRRQCARFAAFAMCLGIGWPAWADDVIVFSTPTLKGVVEDVRPAFEKETGHRIVAVYGPAAALARRIDAGETFDLAILLEPQFAKLASSGATAPAARLARAVAGVAVRSGNAGSRDFSTEEALRKAIVEARTLAFAEDSASGAYFASLFDRLGIPGEKSKLKTFHDPVGAVAAGEADFTVITVPNIIGVPGVSLGGRLPESLQHPTVFWIAAAARSPHAGAAARFADTLRGAQGAYASHGLEPLSP